MNVPEKKGDFCGRNSLILKEEAGREQQGEGKAVKENPSGLT
jgi:hypothetical protein